MRMYGEIVMSSVDGPGRRAVMHTAGCTVGCRGCFSPHTHSDEGPRVWSATPVEVAVKTFGVMADAICFDGVTISGGEPTDQIDDLYQLLRSLRHGGCDSVVMFTGRKIEWLRKRHETWNRIEDEGLIDVVIDSPFVQNKLEQGDWMRGSSNQRFWFLTERHSLSEFAVREVEVQVTPGGRIVMLGFPSPEMIAELATEEA